MFCNSVCSLKERIEKEEGREEREREKEQGEEGRKERRKLILRFTLSSILGPPPKRF